MKTVTSKDGTTIAYDQVGQGQPVILVDGAFCSRQFGPMPALSALLAPHFTVISYDRRGRGDSTNTAPYAVEREIEDLEALVDAAGGSAYVYGISSGAVLALETANKIPGKIKKLAMYEPPFLVDNSKAPQPDDYVANVNKYVAEGRPGDAVVQFMRLVETPEEVIGQMQHSPAWPGLEALAPTLAYDGTIVADYHKGQPLPADRWTAVTMPTLIMDGGAGQEFMHSGADALAKLLPVVERRTLPGQTHDVAADAIAPQLIEFFGSEK